MNRKELENKLSHLGKMANPKLRENLTRKVDIFKQERERLDALANRRGISPKQRDQIIRLKNQEHLHKIREEINPEVAQKLDKEITNIVQQKIKSGDLPDPKQVIKNDPFVKERLERMSS